MEFLLPVDKARLAKTTANVLAIHSDECALTASIWFWELAKERNAEVARRAVKLQDPVTRDSCVRFMEEPQRPDLYDGVIARVKNALDAGMADVYEMALYAHTSDSYSRMGFHQGASYTAEHEPVSFDELLSFAKTEAPAGTQPRDVVIVIPFQDRCAEGHRANNLLACLAALNDQTYPRRHFKTVVVEADSVPRWRHVIAERCDQYIFAENAGIFNKSWTINVGVVNSQNADCLLCILDADMLVDKRFVERNVNRFRRPGIGGLFPYREVLYLDASASRVAIRERCASRHAAAGLPSLRGFYLRRPRGGCVWVRRGAFEYVSGMDERYDGWGAEDTDFAYRLDQHFAVYSYDDVLLHLYHQSAARIVDGVWSTPMLSWKPSERIGDLTRYSRR